MHRIAPPDDLQQPAKTKPQKRKSYRDFIRTLPCIITRQHGVECAHVSFKNEALGASGRGKSQKADDRWTLPLSPALHDQQHRYAPSPLFYRDYKNSNLTGEQRFWKDRDIDPHLACLTLWGLFTENPDTAEQRATELIMSGKIGRT